MKNKIVILGCLDTKGEEYNFIRENIARAGCDCLIIDVGVIDPPQIKPDISRYEVAKAAGEDLNRLIKEGPTRDRIAPIMAGGAKKIVADLVSREAVHGIISCGGTQGTSLATEVMRALPIGFPKVMVSTLASGDTFKFVGLRDIIMINSVADIMGLNRITRKILANASAAVYGAAKLELASTEDKKYLIGITTVGITTQGAVKAKEILEKAGYETVVFHAVGTGGQAMEQLIKEGMINGVLDLATIEVVQELLGGYLAATSERMTVAVRMGIPQVICPGAVSVNTYGPPETIPDKFKDRATVRHSPLFTNVRVNAEEMKKLAKEQAGRVGSGKGLIEWFVPMGGFCSYSIKGQPLYDPSSDKAYLETLKKELKKDIPIYVRETDINDPAFATEIADHLTKLMSKKYN